MPPQVLHIFRKDLRHLWPETLIGVILLVLFGWSATLKGTSGPYSFYATLLGGFLHILIPIAWLVIISRLIHDEPLVGDRQFWTSRPYHWAKLLLAKLLYMGVFIYLPFLLMQVFLLKHAGLHPTTVIPALLHNLLLLTVIIIVPIAAIAAVTSTFAKVLLSTLGAIVYVIILVAIAGYLFFDHMLPPHSNGIAATVLILLPAIALVYQYATRRTAIARIMLISAPVLALLLFLIIPAGALIRASYPAVPTAGGPRLTAFPIPDHPITGSLRLLPRSNTQVALPFKVEGVDKDSDYIIRGVALTLDAPGVHWTSPYVSSLFGPGQINANPFTVLAATIPLDLFNKVHLAPADLHLSVATEHLKAAPMTTWKSSLSDFDIPGHGRCSFSADNAATPALCRFPFETPQFLFVTASVSADCTNAAAPHVEGSQEVGGPAGSLNFDPVVYVPLEPSTGNPQRHGHLCPGTPLNFTQDTSLGNARLEIDDKQIILDPLAARNTPMPAQQMQPGPSEQQ